MNKWVIATALFACSSLATPIVAMVLLPPNTFGQFSAVYIVFSLATTLISVIVCDPWSRSRRGMTERESTRDDGYFQNALLVSIVGATASGTAAWVITSAGSIAFASGAASGVGCYRLASRYFAIGHGSLTRVIRADGLSLLLQIAVLTGGLYASRPLEAVYYSWLAGALGGCVGIGPRVRLTGYSTAVARWFRTHRRAMVAYLGDSGTVSAKDLALMLILFPALGPGGYGLFRALGNATSPVRTVVMAVRPRLIILGPQRTANPRAIWIAVLVSFVLGGLAYLVAAGVARAPADLGTLSALLVFPEACGLAVCGSLMSQYFAGLCRGFVRLSLVVTVRVLTSAVALITIVGCALLAGVEGALYAFAGVMILEGIAWGSILFCIPGRQRPGPFGEEPA